MIKRQRQTRSEWSGRARGAVFGIAVGAGMTLLSGAAWAGGVQLPANFFVNDDRPPLQGATSDCETPFSNTIQEAVAAAPPGSRIFVCEGTYREQVVINKPLTLIGLDLPTILAPDTLQPFFTEDSFQDRAIVQFTTGADPAVIRGFVISGPQRDSNGCNNFFYGIFVGGGASATIARNNIVEIRNADPALRGCQSGEGIRVGASFAEQSGRADIRGNRIERYGKNGLTIDNEGTIVEADSNFIRGSGPNDDIAQNGIQVSRFAQASLFDNLIARNAFTGPDFFASGIILFQVDNRVRARANRLTGNDVGVSVDSIDVADGPLIVDNRVVNSAKDGIGLFTFREDDDNNPNTPDAILPTINTVVRGNIVRMSGKDGIFVDRDSVGNKLARNTAEESGEHDCHDDNPGATRTAPNRWMGNRGEDSLPAGLCVPNAPGAESTLAADDLDQLANRAPIGAPKEGGRPSHGR